MKMIIFFAMTVCLYGNMMVDDPSAFNWVTAVHDTNRVQMTISNYGIFGNSGGAGCWWPKGSGQTYIFGAGFWFGTVEPGSGDTLVSVGYGPHGGETEFAPGLNGMAPNHPCAIIYINPENYPPPSDTFPMAPQDLVSHEDSWCCFNDCDSAYHMPGDTRPIGIEVYQAGYEWMRTEIQDVFYMTYEFKNVSGHGLEDCYVGVITDCDIGNESGTGNDIVAGILGRWYELNGGADSIWVDDIGYQWQEDPETGWNPPVPGVVGLDLLQTPFDLAPGEDKDHDGIPDQYERDSAYYYQNVPPVQWDADLDLVPDWRDASENPQKGMTAFKRQTLISEPNTDPRRYLTLAGYNWQTGAYEPYDTFQFAPDDQRFLVSTGPVDIPQDSIVTIVFAVMFAYWHDSYGSPDTALAVVDNTAQFWYDMSWFRYLAVGEHANRERTDASILVYPNPSRQSGKLRFTVSSPGNVTLELYDPAGQLVKTIFSGFKTAGTFEVRLDIRGLSAGTYFAVLNANGRRSTRRFVAVK